jgi:hypothetical protein
MDNVNLGEDQSPLSALVGEGKKYKTVEDLAKSRLEADRFIDTLKQEKNDLESRMTALQVEIEKQKKTTSPVTPNTPQSVTEESLQALVDKALSDRERTVTRTRNLDDAKKYLMDNFGDRAEEILNSQATSMGISKDKLFEIASDTPVLFKRLFPSEKPKTQDPTSGTTNTEALEFNHTSETSEYKALSEARRKKGVGAFFSDPNNWKKLVEAKKKELSQAS